MAVAERPLDALKGQHVGKTRIKDVRSEVREDSSERPALFIVLVLSEPPKGEETWPVDDLWELRRKVRDAMIAAEPEPDMPWFVAFESEDHEELDAEDIGELIDVDDA